jgi:hypothetical protein
LDRAQKDSRSGDIVVKFLRAAFYMACVRPGWMGGLTQRQHWQSEINNALSASGYMVDVDGEVQPAAPAFSPVVRAARNLETLRQNPAMLQQLGVKASFQDLIKLVEQAIQSGDEPFLHLFNDLFGGQTAPRPLEKRDVRVPTIYDDRDGWNTLFDLWGQVNQDDLKVTFDFSQCGRLEHSAVAFLGGLARLVEHRGGEAVFDWQSLDPHVGLDLARNGFRTTFGDSTAADPGQTIPYREDKTASDAAIMTYLKRQWLGRGWVNISDNLRDAIVSKVWEIYANAFEHGASPIGVFTCGEHYGGQGLLKLTVIDFGTGIPANVRAFQDDPELPAHDAMNWAFQPGHTTKIASMIGRGLGLDLLRRFIFLNKGCLEVFSHDGYARIEEKGQTYETRGNMFEGTILNISLHCDDSYYCFTSEQPSSPLF